MDYVITKQSQQYILNRGKIIVNACPGSGKTTSVAYKLKSILEKWDSKYSGVVCLSFTNVAKDEINEKFHGFTGNFIKYPHLVSTIDSFINQHITLPHYHLLGFQERPIIIEDNSILDSFQLTRFRINNRPIQYMYNPSKIDIAADGSYLFGGSPSTLEGVDKAIFNRYCTELKRIQFQRGLLKNSDSLYLALKLMREYPQIPEMLVNRYKYFIIDEAQDTSELQHLIFEKLIEHGLENIELIGDPYQSLYEWRDARPDLFLDKLRAPGWKSLEMSECRRSVFPIVKSYSIFRTIEHDNLISTVEYRDEEPPIHIIYFNNIENLLGKYEELSSKYEEKKVLVRGSKLLRELHAVSSNHDYWRPIPFSPLQFLYAKSEMQNGYLKVAVNSIYKLIPSLIDPTLIENQRKRREFLENNNDNYELKSKILFVLMNLPSLTKNLKDWTDEFSKLCKDIFNLPELPIFSLKQGNYRPFHKQSINELYREAVNSAKVTTIHKVKGKTFDSVMVVLSPNSTGANLSISDFVKPSQMPDEKKRMLYVAMSRPRWQLVIAIPSEVKLSEEHEVILFGDQRLVHEI